jgi:hypothetical protein
LKAVEKWFQDRDNLQSQRKCLQALYYPKLGSREKEVEDAHEQTFGWIFEDRSSYSHGVRIDLWEAVQHNTDEVHHKSRKFQEWLQSEDPGQSNVFWISGKPGSGKSTMMRFLASHSKLYRFLATWSKDETLILVHHYFWKESSSPLHRSLTGLLRSILHQILEQCPTLIDVAFNNEIWLNGGENFKFSSEVLHNALRKVLASAPGLRLKIFLLVDDLDEFDDQDGYESGVSNERELINFLRAFRKRPSMKLCVASRPLEIFRQELGDEDDFHFYLHELTRKDIQIYIQETLEKEKIFLQLVKKDKGYQELVDEIVHAAQGVFLWVRIVVCRLLDGMTNADRFSDLQRKLRELPWEPESLYMHILSSLDSVKKRWAARILLALITVRRVRITPLSAAFIYLDPAEHPGIIKAEDMTPQNLMELQKQLRTPINACCRGLVEIKVARWRSADSFVDRIAHGEELILAHHTIGEFLRLPRMKNFLAEIGGVNETFIAYFLCKGNLALMRAAAHAGPRTPWYLLYNFGHLTDDLESFDHDDLAHRLRLDLEQVCKVALFETGYDIVKSTIESDCRMGLRLTPGGGYLIPLAIMLRWGLRYLKRRLNKDAEPLDAQDWALALVLYINGLGEWPWDVSEITEIPCILLKQRVDLTRPIGDTTYCELLVDAVWNLWHQDRMRTPSVMGLLAECLRYGGCPNIQCKMVAVIHEEVPKNPRRLSRVVIQSERRFKEHSGPSFNLVEPSLKSFKGVFYCSLQSMIQTVFRYFTLHDTDINESLITSTKVLPEAAFIEAKAIEDLCDFAEAEGIQVPEERKNTCLLEALACASQELASYCQWREGVMWDPDQSINSLYDLACSSPDLASYWQWRAGLLPRPAGQSERHYSHSLAVLLEEDQWDRHELEALSCNSQDLASYCQWKAKRQGRLVQNIEKVRATATCYVY